MPHQCTECGYTFPDGSKEMLSGCPDCGGNKFQYHPGATPDEPDDESPPERPDAGVSGAVGRAANTVRDVLGDDERSEPPGASRSDAPAESESTDETPDEPAPQADASSPAREDRAQADARSEVVDAEDLPDPPADDAGETADTAPDADRADADEPTPDPAEIDSTEPDAPASGGADESPELSELREELNSQFESIRIVEPGQYELNLMELYDREQYIIALQEDGRYVIDVPDSWRDDA